MDPTNGTLLIQFDLLPPSYLTECVPVVQWPGEGSLSRSWGQRTGLPPPRWRECARCRRVLLSRSGRARRMIKLILAPVRSMGRFPLLQFAVVIGVILWLQAADDRSIFGQIFNSLDKLVGAPVQLFSAVFTVKSFTKSWLISGFMIAYVYLAGSLLLFLVRLMIIATVDFVGRSNLLYLGIAIARGRCIGAYRAWIPLERIRPAHISQQEWEQTYAWPANNKPPAPPLGRRIMR